MLKLDLNDKRYDKLTEIVIILFSIIGLALAVLTPSQTVGECDDYMLATVALENRLALNILPEDVEIAMRDFPNQSQHIYNSYYEYGMPTTEDGRVYPWYFITYSIICIPMKKLLKLFAMDQGLAYAITNILIYIGALLVIYKKLKRSKLQIFLTTLLIACSPAVLYYYWPSAEIFIFSMIVISLVFFANKQHRLAGLFVSIAGTLNLTIMVYGAIIILDYFIELFKKVKGQVITKDKVKYYFKDTILLGICFIPCLIPPIINYINFGSISLQIASGGFIDNTSILSRFWAYLFDVNFGILPYFSVAFILYIILITIGIVERNTCAILYLIAFLGTVFSYSIMAHINSGMTGIARYNVWASPLIIFFLTTEGINLVKGPGFRQIVAGGLIVSSLLGAINVEVILKHPIYTYMTPLADTVLKHCPSLYNPLYSTFISRVEHVDGGYIYTEPVYYKLEDGRVKKILVTSETAEQVITDTNGNQEDMNFIQYQVEKIKAQKGYHYINISRKMNIRMNTFDREEANKFVTRLYDICLGREASQKDKAYWTGCLEGKLLTGSSLINAFLESEEFKMKQLSDEEYISVMYNLCFERDPDEEERKQWGNYLLQTVDKNSMVQELFGTIEFKRVCSKYTIQP